MTAEDKEKCAYLVNHYGARSQLDVLVEECAELIQAAQKLKRVGFEHLPFQCVELSLNFVEEMADVSIMIQQFLSLNTAPVDIYKQIISQKLERQLERIAAEREKE